ncbi:MAG: DUF6438 domain-containing protein [Bacteroidetes bacterium]|nr:DUF6438 domain-containing protein [Bacteroidota bacterium]
MKTRNHILKLSILLILLACKQGSKIPNKSEERILKVTVAFAGYGCEGFCPFEAISVDSSLKLKYWGDQFAFKRGSFCKQVTNQIWDSIKTNFQKFVISGLDSSKITITDSPEMELYIKTTKGEYAFSKNTGKMSTRDTDILEWFQEIKSRSDDLKPCNYTPFETTIQFPK